MLTIGRRRIPPAGPGRTQANVSTPAPSPTVMKKPPATAQASPQARNSPTQLQEIKFGQFKGLGLAYALLSLWQLQPPTH